ncbi:SMI1/KNR4 family protein [Cronobacter malonaticus]|uniref:SMI1/KNR4 family protein n=3 Tax=Cronobacter malonaticus TaxID=413503 RepID=UPI000518BCBC|nr:SMI1/KNR4 family protein [Cronobacter malonaticus]EGT4383733.1 SMI1/KNR4 family protein [Cronobacter malonaticus]EGT4421728.1 SMI1/KNR4 family protein [Cronobacter malonaticus]EGT4446558.1 SMI1/KNR4 family protein [Cronobacter malonaticus]EGT4454070.1 SMI1/KNR4 family protein [Cronobacter malonaticus]MDI6406900.1 SMI1/KNR4 family protein [Cronobacter malonaticus]
MNKHIESINKIEVERNIKFPPLYKKFLANEVKDSDTYEISNKDSGTIYLYSYIDLVERNETYDIQSVEPYYFLIGQDGDLGYFIYVESGKESDVIFSVDLGALGSLEMTEEAKDIYSLSA